MTYIVKLRVKHTILGSITILDSIVLHCHFQQSCLFHPYNPWFPIVTWYVCNLTYSYFVHINIGHTSRKNRFQPNYLFHFFLLASFFLFTWLKFLRFELHTPLSHHLITMLHWGTPDSDLINFFPSPPWQF